MRVPAPVQIETEETRSYCLRRDAEEVLRTGSMARIEPDLFEKPIFRVTKCLHPQTRKSVLRRPGGRFCIDISTPKFIKPQLHRTAGRLSLSTALRLVLTAARAGIDWNAKFFRARGITERPDFPRALFSQKTKRRACGQAN